MKTPFPTTTAGLRPRDTARTDPGVFEMTSGCGAHSRGRLLDTATGWAACPMVNDHISPKDCGVTRPVFRTGAPCCTLPVACDADLCQQASGGTGTFCLLQYCFQRLAAHARVHIAHQWMNNRLEHAVCMED